MKNEYVSPEFEVLKITMEDVILGSTEETIPEIIGGDTPDPNPDPPSLDDF